MATRTIPFAVYKTDGTRYTESTPPTTTVQYGTGSATAITATQRGNAWSVDIDDTQDALVMWSGVDVQPDHIIALRFPTQLDVAVSTRLATASYTAPDNTSIAAIKTKTDNLPASPAATGAAMTLTPAYDAAKVAASQSSVDGLNDISVADIEASTVLAMKSDIPTDYSTFDHTVDTVVVGTNGDKTGYVLTSAYDAAKTAAQPSDIPTDYAKDATVMKSNDANITAIKAKTDNLPSDPADQSVLAGLIDALPTAEETADAVWDEVLTGATHNIASSAGRRLRQVTAPIIHSGIAQGGGVNGNQIILDTAASSVNGTYDPAIISIVSGTGSGQTRRILEYNGATRIATVNRNWRVAPDNTSEFVITSDAGGLSVNEGLVVGATVNTVTLNTDAKSVDDMYVGEVISIISGTGDDQTRVITAYAGATRVATVDHPWETVPDNTSGYEMLPLAITLDYATAAQVEALNDVSMVDVATVLSEYGVATVEDIPTDYATEETAADILKWNTNRRVVTDTEQVLYDDDNVTPLYTQALTGDDTFVERGKGV